MQELSTAAPTEGTESDPTQREGSDAKVDPAQEALDDTGLHPEPLFLAGASHPPFSSGLKFNWVTG